MAPNENVVKMKQQHVYRQVEVDPLTDTELTHITAEDLISQLRLSRQILAVAEFDKQIFEEDRLYQIEEAARIKEDHLERKRQAELTIRYCQDNLYLVQEWLEDIWVRYGRSRTEALPFRRVPRARIRLELQKRINTKRRWMDSVGYVIRAGAVRRKGGDEWRWHLEHVSFVSGRIILSVRDSLIRFLDRIFGLHNLFSLNSSS